MQTHASLRVHKGLVDKAEELSDLQKVSDPGLIPPSEIEIGRRLIDL